MDKIAVYAIVCLENKKCYVGGTGNYRFRINAHRSFLRRGKHPNHRLQADWVTFGEKRFEFRILEEAPKAALRMLEGQWISKMDSYRTGYNEDETGSGGVRGERQRDAVINAVIAASIKKRLASGERPISIYKSMGLSRDIVHHISSLRTWLFVEPELNEKIRSMNFTTGSGHALSKITDEEAAEMKVMLAQGVRPTDISDKLRISINTVRQAALLRCWVGVRPDLNKYVNKAARARARANGRVGD